MRDRYRLGEGGATGAGVDSRPGCGSRSRSSSTSSSRRTAPAGFQLPHLGYRDLTPTHPVQRLEKRIQGLPQTPVGGVGARVCPAASTSASRGTTIRLAVQTPSPAGWLGSSNGCCRAATPAVAIFRTFASQSPSPGSCRCSSPQVTTVTGRKAESRAEVTPLAAVGQLTRRVSSIRLDGEDARVVAGRTVGRPLTTRSTNRWKSGRGCATRLEPASGRHRRPAGASLSLATIARGSSNDSAST